MSLLQVDHLSKSFGVLHLFSDLTFVINKGQKVGLIAPNGSGKSTLLKIIAGEETADSGEVTTRKDVRISYLPQINDFSGYDNILQACISGIRPELRDVIVRYEEALHSGDAELITQVMMEMDTAAAWDIEQELMTILNKLRLDDPFMRTTNLSGGESKRIALASVLIDSPELLILDEPTNHLDPEIIEWLEEYLSARHIALLMVTHDRYFLDAVCDSIYEIDQGEIYTYEGNYSLYLRKKEERMDQLNREQQSLRNLYKRELEWMRRMPQARATKAKYRKDAFYETESKLKSVKAATGPQLEAANVYIGKKIFEAEHVSKSFGDRVIIDDFTYIFGRRERVGIIGPNGAGKSTLVKLILGEYEPTSGVIERGETLRIGYFAQIAPDIPSDKKVIEVITDIAEKIDLGDGSTLTAMQLLNRFLFPPSRQYDFVEKLSGGELRRLYLCTVLMKNPNFLVLDEPTNDLDIPTLQVLEDYLREFNGCLIIVSHDRYFMDNLTGHLFVLTGDGSVRDFPGNYTEYLLISREEKRQAQIEAAQVKKEEKDSITQRPEREKKNKRTYKEEQEFMALGQDIEKTEKAMKQLQEEMSSGQVEGEELLELSEAYQKYQEALDEMEMRWLELSEKDD